MSALILKGLRHGFGSGERRVQVLDGVDLTIKPGEIVALVGQSGAGKSTLLQLAGLLEAAEEGQILIGGQDVRRMGEAGRTRTRARDIGFVYQFHHLLPEFSALDNVALPLRIVGTGQRDARARATDLLTRLGLKERLSHRPSQLSGGEQQRTAIARAIAHRPKLLLADEPTGNLDEATAATVMDSLTNLVRNEGLAALIATHNRALADTMDRTVTLTAGKLH